MVFKTLELKSPLNKFIESIFYFKHFLPKHSIERVVPTGHIFIIFELDEIQRNTFNNKTLKPNETFKNTIKKNLASLNCEVLFYFVITRSEMTW
jgi:tetrahydromethanopterin S-methyltransferase subunit C